MNRFAKIAVRTPLWRSLEYRVPEHLVTDLQLGHRVLVSFGKRQVAGIVLAFSEQSTIEIAKLKSIQALLDPEPMLNDSILRLCEWASDYYHFPLGEVIFNSMPAKLKENKSIARYRDKVLEQSHDPLVQHKVEPAAFELSDAQKQAVEVMQQLQGFGGVLLHGVTGSGKTEVYLHAIESCIAQGKQALMLVPEISLTLQTLHRFQARLGADSVVVMHSALKENDRLRHWLLVQLGLAQVLIGTRSAVFTPLPRLGLIIVDEEHDASFKQQTGFRYSARDVAVMRAYQERIPVLLGSATPSLESLYNAWESGRYHYQLLPERAGSGKMPAITILDMRQQKLISGLSQSLFARVQQHLQANGQVLFFLNRRGYAPILLCHHCGFCLPCPRCDAYLTYHHKLRQLRCHHCDYLVLAPRVCPHCHQADLIPMGLGTERLEETLSQHFKDQHIIRIDRDTTRQKGALEDLLTAAHTQTAHLLIGTQMLAKGHHFSNLSLVVVVDADSGLLSTDFRALEHLAQLLTQVAGRPGRENHKGEVIIQTHHPDHPMLNTLVTQGYTAFARQLLLERQETELPPYGYLALFRAEHREEAQAMAFLNTLKEHLAVYASKKIRLLGPVGAPLLRRAGKARVQLLIQSESRFELQSLLTRGMADPWLKEQRQKVRWSLDVDPIEFL